MPKDQPAIERLPVPTQAKLRSTQILTSFPQIASELLQNSLDANATHIEVGLDCREWMCWVRDNGHGISKDGLELLGQGEEGNRYNTSKTYAPGSSNSFSTFGFRGEALASAAGVSCLEICSRTSKSRNTWSLIIKGDQVLYRGPAVRWKRESPGTTVCIRDAFYNLPVRRLSHTSPSRTWDLVRLEIERYSLMFPHVSFTLEDTSRAGDPSQQHHTFRIPKNSSILGAFRNLYGHALTNHIEEVDTAYGTMKMEGFISLTGASSKAYQFFYINRHPVTESDLSRVIDSQFAFSSFGKNALDEEGEKNIPRSTIRRSPRKAEKKPVYVLDISIPPEEVDNCLDPSKSIVQLRNKSNVLAFLSSTVQSFLEKHGFLNKNQITFGGSTNSSSSPRKRKKVNIDDSGYAEADSISEISGLSLQDDKRASQVSSSGALYTSTEGISEEIVWMDPSTGQSFLVDSRTGNSHRQSGSHPQADNEMSTIIDPQEGRRTLRQQKTDNSAKTGSDLGQSSVPAWLKQALESNRAYAIPENRISTFKVPPVSYHNPQSYDTLPGDRHGCHTPQNPEIFRMEHFESTFVTLSHRFTRDDIRHAEIINQVDRKFIACRVAKRSSGTTSPQGRHNQRLTSDSLLVLIDQHAADERVRVERFLKELFLGFLCSQDRTGGNQIGGVRIRELNPPHPVLLTQHEALTIDRSPDVREMLRKWGVRFAELSTVKPDSDGNSEPGSSSGYSQLLVSSIPEVVSDKLLQGDELRDFIKGFLAQIQSGELFPDSSLELPSEEDQDESLWFKAVRRCPRGLLDLINSKACRGAIMFNDSLSLSQCEQLVKQLSETVFPFQCAHGRPSLVPLVETGQLQLYSHKRKRRRNDWTRLETMADA